MTILITGGARSGKSAYAENLLKEKEDVVYIATAEVLDEEMRERVRKHIERRCKNWRTEEIFKNLVSSVGKEKYYLLDCITNMVSRILFENTKDGRKITSETVKQTSETAIYEITKLSEKINKAKGTLLLVTNEVGNSIVPMNPLARAFRDVQGIVNAKIAAIADEVVLTVCGLPLFLKKAGQPVII